MTNEDFAHLIDSPLPTVKFFGRRPMSDTFLYKIRMTTGASWKSASKRWVFAFSPAGTEVQYTHEIWLAWRALLETPPDSAQFLARMIGDKVALLLKLAHPSQFNRLWFRIERAIADWQEEFSVTGTVLILKQAESDGGRELTQQFEEYLRQLRPAFIMGVNPETGKPEKFIRISPAYSEVYKPGFPHPVFSPVEVPKEKPVRVTPAAISKTPRSSGGQ